MPLIAQHYKMENQKKLIIGGIITLLLASSGVYFVAQDDDAFYCESRDMVMICEKLSSGIGTRCYYAETYKTCKEGWVKIELNQEINTQVTGDLFNPESTNGVKWECSPKECIRIE